MDVSERKLYKNEQRREIALFQNLLYNHYSHSHYSM